MRPVLGARGTNEADWNAGEAKVLASRLEDLASLTSEHVLGQLFVSRIGEPAQEQAVGGEQLRPILVPRKL